eukprot:TRINITY_DN1718_c0_g1_i9.p1 TRINITY_DN1718_c0_g1~~TRINITY_DN1718_c0_g1_i9.p1  ORF type:complete len:282 (-),score=50.90 TRINITY_DN1718_c0_g1_i9:4-849(-)
MDKREVQMNKEKSLAVSLFLLPRDVILHLLSILPLSDILNISTLNRSMRDLVENDQLWRRLFEQSYRKRDLVLPTTPSHRTWKESYKNIIYHQTFIEGGDNILIRKNIAGLKTPMEYGEMQMVFGRFHNSGKHRYTLNIDEKSYIGVGVASREITGDRVKESEILHSTAGCSVYYDSGVWYGRQETKSNDLGDERDPFDKGDQINLYFDVDNQQVAYYKGSKLLIKCMTFRENDLYPDIIPSDKLEKGLRLGLVLGAQNSQVTIVDYRPVDAFPVDDVIDK